MTTEGQLRIPARYRQLRTAALVLATGLMIVAATFAGIQLAGPSTNRLPGRRPEAPSSSPGRPRSFCSS